MANTAQARKRARQNDRRRTINMARRSMIRTDIKRLLKLIKTKDVDGAKTAYRQASSSIDRGVNKSLISRNRAARLKSRLNKRLHLINA